jgi:molybdenum cofactor cytidylyltransferase
MYPGFCFTIQSMNLLRALRLDHSPTHSPVISLAGAGGKTTALFQLARQISNRGRPSGPGNHAGKAAAVVTSTTHLGTWQIPLADKHIIAADDGDLHDIPNQGVLLVTGGIEGDRTRPVRETVLNWLHEYTMEQNIPLLIEADGARQKPLKAPAAHEPPIPRFSDMVIHVTGLRALGKPLHEEFVHRAEVFSQLSGLPRGDTVTRKPLLTCSPTHRAD